MTRRTGIVFNRPFQADVSAGAARCCERLYYYSFPRSVKSLFHIYSTSLLDPRSTWHALRTHCGNVIRGICVSCRAPYAVPRKPTVVPLNRCFVLHLLPEAKTLVVRLVFLLKLTLTIQFR